MRSGIEIWIDEEQETGIINIVNNQKESKLIGVNNETINTSDISGIHTPEAIALMNNRKSGKWQCEFGNWHDRFQKCNCEEIKRQDELDEQRRKEAMEKCKVYTQEEIDKEVDNYIAKFQECEYVEQIWHMLDIMPDQVRADKRLQQAKDDNKLRIRQNGN